MNNFNKYFLLMALIIGGFFGVIIFLVLLFFILKLFSVTILSIPGVESIYHFLIVIIPYIIFFSAYYYLHKKIPLSTKKISRLLAMLFLVAGSLICFTTLVLSLLDFIKLNKTWIRLFNDNAQYAFIIQIILLFSTALIIAAGDPKEKDWMEKGGYNK